MQLNTHRKLGIIFSYCVILQELVPHLEFCLVIRLIEPKTYGARMVELAEDISDTAFSRQKQNLTIG